MKVKLKSRKGGAGTAGALMLLALGLSGCGLLGGDDKPAASKPPAAPAGFRPGQVAFGVLAPLSGPQSQRGTDLVDGAKLAMADLNVRGGVIGQKVALVTHDDGCTAAAGRESARALDGSEVAGALGGICASAARSAARTLDTGLPFLVTSANAPSIAD